MRGLLLIDGETPEGGIRRIGYVDCEGLPSGMDPLAEAKNLADDAMANGPWYGAKVIHENTMQTLARRKAWTGWKA